jgi:5-methyltetrahydrofolate--homocysteine methyltransferase
LMPFMEAEKNAVGSAMSSAGKVLLATVKGDVHDIGKNIVGVVLGCNNYEIIDLGVMVPCETILKEAVERKVDIIGLSGLITPSLDEMVFVAKEMERKGFQTPLLIGGATTSRQHTAVKIAPQYGQSTVHVLDASRAVGVVSSLLDAKKRETLDAENRADQARLRELHGNKRVKQLVPVDVARKNRLAVEFKKEDVAVPSFVGPRRIESANLAEIREYIDWTFFFTAWELKGKFPAILEHPQYGEAARDLYAHATKLLDKIVNEKLLTANGAYGFFPASGEGEDIVLYTDESRSKELLRFPMLRQQLAKNDASPHLSLADFVAPKSSGIPDYVGAFAVTAGLGCEALAKSYEKAHDDYSAIIVKALADRLAEAFAEMLHARVRKEWGYGAGEHYTQDELREEKYRGIRPAFGYPACPDHTEKRKLFSLIEAEQVGIGLTEHFAMTPAASVSGIYLAHPQARYFMVGRIDRDQVEDYAHRKGIPLSEAERWLAPNLSYEPAAAAE